MAFANLVVEVGLNGSAFERGVSKVIAKAQEMNAAFGKSVTSIASNQISQAFAVAAVVNKMQAGISEAIAFGSSISDLSTKLNVSTDSLQLWNYAATQNGATLASVDEMFTKLAINSQIAVNGNLEMVAAFRKLGVTIDDVKNKKPEDIARLIGKAFESGVDPNTLVGSLRAVGGRGADALIKAFEAGIGTTFDDGLKLNIIINADELAKIDALGDRLDVIQMQMRPVFFGIAIVLAQVAEAIYDSVRLLTAGVMDLKNNFTDPMGYEGIKDPKLREKVIEQNAKDQAKRNIDPENKYNFFGGGVVSAKETVEGMRSEKMDELNKLNNGKKEFDAAQSAAQGKQVISEFDTVAQTEMVDLMAEETAARVEAWQKKDDSFALALKEAIEKGRITGDFDVEKRIKDSKAEKKGSNIAKTDPEYNRRADEIFANFTSERANARTKAQEKAQAVFDRALVEGRTINDPNATSQESLDSIDKINAEFEAEKAKLQAELKELTEAYVEPFSAVSTLVQEKIDQINAEAKALEEAAAKRLETRRNKPLVNESIPKKLRPVKDAELLPKITDSLSKVGGFTMGRDVISLTVAKQQLAVLETIADNTKDIKPPEGDGL